jgi:PilZ domain
MALAMPERKIDDKRHSPRIPCKIETRGAVLRLFEAEETQLAFEGTAENISPGGVNISTDESVPLEAVVRCEFTILESGAIAIPSLLKVCWCDRSPQTRRYKVGLQFLL